MNKILKLDNGVELPYIELGENNTEPLIMGQFYFTTFKPLLEELAKYFHVYAVTMRTSEPVTEFQTDGTPNWEVMWSKEIYEFSRKMGLEEFIYAGKCHGTVPGWHLLRTHPEAIKGYVLFSLLPTDRTPGFVNQKFMNVMKYQVIDTRKFVELCLRNHDLVDKKLDEMRSANLQLIRTGNQKELSEIKTNEGLFEYYKTITVPTLLVYGSEDPGLDENMYMKSIMAIPGMKAVMYQGERHFFEMDIPETIASDVAHWARQKGLLV